MWKINHCHHKDISIKSIDHKYAFTFSLPISELWLSSMLKACRGCCGNWSPAWNMISFSLQFVNHDDVIKWKHFPRYWPFVRGIPRSPVNSPHKGQWRGALMFSLICARIIAWVNNRKAGDFRRHRAHYDVIVMIMVHAYNTSSASRVYPNCLCLLPNDFKLPQMKYSPNQINFSGMGVVRENLPWTNCAYM